MCTDRGLRAAELPMVSASDVSGYSDGDLDAKGDSDEDPELRGGL